MNLDNGIAWHEAGFQRRALATADRLAVACNGCGRGVFGNRRMDSMILSPSAGPQAPPCQPAEGSGQSKARARSASGRHGARANHGVDCDSDSMNLFAPPVNPCHLHQICGRSLDCRAARGLSNCCFKRQHSLPNYDITLTDSRRYRAQYSVTDTLVCSALGTTQRADLALRA